MYSIQTKTREPSKVQASVRKKERKICYQAGIIQNNEYGKQTHTHFYNTGISYLLLVFISTIEGSDKSTGPFLGVLSSHHKPKKKAGEGSIQLGKL